MSSKMSWLLMSPEEIAQVIVSNNGLFRRQKSYYKTTGNVVMIARIAEAEELAKVG